jgi:hypothetical protein
MKPETNQPLQSPTKPQTQPHPQPTLPPPRELSQFETMRQSSPHGGVVLPPPLAHSQSQSPRQSLTLPPLSTLSPMNKPSSTISNLIHPHVEKRGESSSSTHLPAYRRDSQLSPRAKARTQSMEGPRHGFPFETIDEHPVYEGHHQGQGHRRPRRSMPTTAERPYS